MTILSGYSDDSRTGGIYVMADYLSISEMWDEVFAPSWKRVLEEAPYPVTELKASDCRHRNSDQIAPLANSRHLV